MFATTNTTNTSHTTASNNNTTNSRSARHAVATGALVVGLSLFGLTACELQVPAATVRSSSATQIDRSTPDTTEPPQTTVTVPDSSLPPISLPTPVTTLPAPASTLPVPTLPAPSVEVPVGSLDLGDGVFVPVSVGWTGTLTDGIVHLTDGSVEVLLQVLRRQPGEHPQAVIDEYVASFVDPIGTVDSRPVTRRWSTDTPRPAMEYGFFYTSFDPNAADGQGIDGGVSAYIRNDGLTLMFDVWAPASVTGALADDAFHTLIDSFLAAPEAATPAPLTMVPDFRVSTTSATALVGPIAGFTVAPGFVIEASNADYALATSATAEIAVLRGTGRTDETDALDVGKGVVVSMLPQAQFAADLVFEAPDTLGVARSSVSFSTGTRSGQLVVFFDTTTGNTYTIVTVWDGAHGAAVDGAALAFMQYSVANSFANIA